MRNRLLNTLLIAGFLGGLVACGNSDQVPKQEAAADKTTIEDSQKAEESSSKAEESDSKVEADNSIIDPNAVPGIDGWEPFKDQVTLQIAVYDRGTNGNGCKDVENNFWTNWVQENFGDKYNIKVEYVGITRSDVMTDYAMLESTKELPTICMEWDYDKLATWASDGYLQPIDFDQFKIVAPTYYKCMEDNGLLDYTKFEGKDYVVLGERPYNNTHYMYVTWYRKDWLKEAGLAETYPTTNSDLLVALEKMVQNGHEYPLSGSKLSGAEADQNYGFRDYPQDEKTWCTTGDYQIPALSTEAQKRLLKWNNELYNKGYINPDYYIRTADDVNNDFINGKAFQWTGYVSSTMDVLNSFYEVNPEAELGVAVCSSDFIQDKKWGSSNSFRPDNKFGALVGFSSYATPEQVKAAQMYLEWMSQEDVLFTMTWGIEGKNFNYDENGFPVAVGNQNGLKEQQGHNNNFDYWMVVTASKTLGDIESDIKAVNPQGLPQDFYEDILANYKGQLALYEKGYANEDCLFGGILKSVTTSGVALKEEIYPEYRDELIMCKPEKFDSLYEELSQKYLSLGYQDVIDERQKMFDEGLTTRLK